MENKESPNSMTVLIKQDIFPGQPFEVTVNGEALPNLRPLSDIREYKLEDATFPCEVIMELIPDWKRGKVEKRALGDLGGTSNVFHNVYNQLPIEAHRVETVNEEDEHELRFKASTLLRLDEDAMWVWRKSAVFQNCGILFILAVIALVVVLALSGTNRIIAAVVSIVILALLGVYMENHRKKTVKKLESLKKTEE